MWNKRANENNVDCDVIISNRSRKTVLMFLGRIENKVDCDVILDGDSPANYKYKYKYK